MSVLHVTSRAQETKPKALRREGIVPMALVDKKLGTRLVQAPSRELARALSHAHGVGMLDLTLDDEKKKRSVILKDVDRDILTKEITHVTLMEISQSDTIRADVPVVGVGTPQQVQDGVASLLHPTDHIKVKGKVSDMPETIEIDVSVLTLADSVLAGQVQLPDGVELLSSPDAVLFTLQIAKTVDQLIEEGAEEVSVEEPEGEEAPIEGEESQES